MMLRIKRKFILSLYKGWRGYARNNTRIRRNFVRIVRFPYIKWWAEYIVLVKQYKRELKLALIAQALGRGG